MCERFQTGGWAGTRRPAAGILRDLLLCCSMGAKRTNRRTHFGRDLESNSIVSPRHRDKLGVHRFGTTSSLMPKPNAYETNPSLHGSAGELARRSASPLPDTFDGADRH